MKCTLRHIIQQPIAFAMAALTVVPSCSKAPAEDKGMLTGLELAAPCISAVTTTRTMPVEGTGFPWQPRDFREGTDYDYFVGLWICDKGTYSPHLEGYCNKQMMFEAKQDGMQWHESDYRYPVKTIPARLSKSIDVYAYYPRIVVDLSNCTPENIPFTTQDQHDWMWADKIVLNDIAPSSQDNRLKFNFHHAMTCLEVRLSTLYDGEITLNRITLSDAKGKLVAKGTMDIRNGDLDFTEDRAELTIKANNYVNEEFQVYKNLLPKAGEGYRSYCFIMPQKDFEDGDLTMTFVFDADQKQGLVPFVVPTRFKDTATWVETDVTTLETGKRYVLNLVIDNGLKIAPVQFSKEDWTTVDVDLKL